MITSLQLQNFKSWEKPDSIGFSKLTGFFGKNSSGKTSLLQSLLILKQTVESTDRKRVLNTGDTRHALVDLGTYFDIIHGHASNAILKFSLAWDLKDALRIPDPKSRNKDLFTIEAMKFETQIKEEFNKPVVESFAYSFINGRNHNGQKYSFGMQRELSTDDPASKDKYSLISPEYKSLRAPGRVWPLPTPVKCYGFPDEATGYFQNMGFLPALALSFEDLFSQMAYLGPLREYPRRSYVWAGESPDDVGKRGDQAVEALLASRNRGRVIKRGQGVASQTVEERVAEWLVRMDLIHSFKIEKIAPNRKDYEVKIKRSENGPDVLITDVGFGVSQILPVLVLCYYVKEGSTVILEQPEIHLHPFVQALLAEVLIDVVKNRDVQVIVESHSEHLLRRLQRCIAEGDVESKDIALYFCDIQDSKSKIEKLNIDLTGNITNWPKNFLGDELGDLIAMTKQSLKRKG